MKKIFLAHCILLLLISCKEISSQTDYIVFDKPQPDNDSELLSLPSKYLGEFRKNDSTFLFVEKKNIIEKNLWFITIDKDSISQITDEYDIKNNIITNKITKEKYSIKPIKDNFIIEFQSFDTIFFFSENQKAKRINGNLILSQRDSIFWTTQIITIKNKILNIKKLNQPNDLKAIDSILNITSKTIDSTQTLLTPTRQQFAKILRLKNLGSNEMFAKK